ncbi:MAG: InlB B-repeat-containing protein [Clostridia bacterium]|nr:InlB B-repeat-containing protein [Clostridia bacterium]
MERQRRNCIAIGIIMVVLCCIALLVCISVCNPSIAKNADQNVNVFPTAAATLNSTYGAFYNGSTYRYTDYTKVDDMHNGAISDDTTMVTVDSDEPHGSHKNPYVIDSETRWNAFVADMNDTSTGITDYGAGKYFVLAVDLDFNGKTFIPISQFCGILYGLGHALSNISYDANGSNGGVITNAENGVIIADLDIVNYEYRNGVMNGGILGAITTGVSLLNCHAQGSIIRPISIGRDLKIGGLIGHITGSTADEFLAYRCSAELNVNVVESNMVYGLGIGSIVGQCMRNTNVTILDCYGEVDATLKLSSSASNMVVYTGILGYINGMIKPILIENYAGSIRVNSAENIPSNFTQGYDSVFGHTNMSSSAKLPSVTLKNVYAKGDVEQSGTVYTMWPHLAGTEANTNFGNPTFSATNVKYAGSGSSKWTVSSNLISSTKLNNASTQVSESQLWTDAKADTAFKANVWTNKSAIGGTYSVATSPVRNTTFDSQEISVKFKNYKTTGDEDLGIADAKYDYASENLLPTPSAPDNNHKFVCWTLNASGEIDSFTKLPANINGDVTLYAVWDNPNATASITLSNSATGNNADTLEYGTGDITLTATSNGPGMSNPTKTFEWYKDGGSSSVGTGDTCVLTDVNQSGAYYLEYTLLDNIELLWRHTEKLTTPQNVTINKGTLKIKSFAIDKDSPAYAGKPLRLVDFNVEIEDNGNNVVPCSKIVWQTPNSTVASGLNDTFYISVTPTDTDNYNSATLNVSFASESLKLTFDLDSAIADEKLEAELTYGDPYSASKIVKMFLTEFWKRLDVNDPLYDPNYLSIENMAPYFDGVEISSYTTNIPDVTTPQRIEVMFIDKNYTVTFNADNGSSNTTQMRKFNQRLNSVPNPTKTEYLFKGWKYDDVDDLGNSVTKYWDFDEDRVKGDITLTADWFKATLTLVDIEVTPKAGGYDALTTMTDSDLEVIAHYTTDSPDYPTYDSKLSLDDVSGYKIIYGSSDGKLHVNNPGITITYSYGGVTRTKSLTLTVNPKLLDEEMSANGVKFENKTVVFDGTAKEIGEVQGELPIQISEVQYEYWFGGSVVEKSSVVNIGLYTVRAKFISSDPDYAASDMEATLTISRTGAAGDIDPDDPSSSGDPNQPADGAFEELLKKLKDLPLWQLIASVISIILILIFVSKTISNESKRKKAKKTIEKKYNTYYAAAFLGLSVTNWTVIACVLMGCALLTMIFMLISQKRRNSAEEQLDEAKEEFERNQRDIDTKRRDEDMKMMFMHMMGGNANGNGQQGGYAYAGQGLGADEIRGIVSETMTAMLPNFQQYLPQQASNNDEVIKDLIEGQKAIMKKLAEKPVERVVEKEVAAASVGDEVLEKLASMMQSNSKVNEKTLEKIVSKLQPVASDETLLKVVAQSGVNDETIKQMLKTQEDLIHNQEKLMEKILELSNNQPAEPQVVEKIVEKEVKVEVPVEVEKVVEKVVEVPVEKIVEKEVPVEVEKIVEKEVVKEVKVEVPVEVEKIVEVPVEVEKVVEKIVEIPAEKPAPKAKVVAPRLTLDEAYAKLSAKQKKIFDTLKAYALSKDKCKEKKSTYSILLGQSSVNPLVKLTIKKDTTVALFKMEDEFMKDIRRNATNDGTKVKVKETELVVADMQALATAKEMVDLREDQIERYNEYLKEQRSMKK